MPIVISLSATFKKSAGPPGTPSSLDPSNAGMSTPSRSATSVRGVDYKFTALIRNTGSKPITTVQWAYFFFPPDPHDAFAYAFTTKINIPPGKEKDLRDQVPSTVIPTSQSRVSAAHNRALFKERVVILRLEYADGSSWQSSGGSGGR